MLRYIVSALCGVSLTGSVYMAGWGNVCPKTTGEVCEDCDSGAMAKPVAFKVPDGKTEVKNTKCIVRVEDIDDSILYVEYKDKVYHICCGSCKEDFAKDPEKYVKALEADPAKFGIKKAN